ncbi:hypothetical protein ACWCL1_04875 [Ligilactobacillus sp. LYQ135]
MQYLKAKHSYDDFLVFEKSAIQNLGWTLEEIENQDYFLLMEILGTDSEEVQQEEVYDDPMELFNKITQEGHT